MWCSSTRELFLKLYSRLNRTIKVHDTQARFGQQWEPAFLTAPQFFILLQHIRTFRFTKLCKPTSSLHLGLFSRGCLRWSVKKLLPRFWENCPPWWCQQEWLWLYWLLSLKNWPRESTRSKQWHWLSPSPDPKIYQETVTEGTHQGNSWVVFP